jgi:HK97 family phage major capsid protein
MDLAQLNEQIKGLGASLRAEMEKNLNDRKVADAEVFAKMLEERLKERDELLEKKLRVAAVPGLSRDSREIKDFKISNLVKAKISGDYSKCGLEVELCLAAAQEFGDYMPNVSQRMGGWARDAQGVVHKDLSTISDPAGGFLVPAQVMANLFIELLQPRSAIEQLGPTVLDNMTSAPVEISGEASDGEAEWQGENDEVTPDDVEYRQISAYPHLLTTACRLSMRLMRMSAPAAEAQVRRAIGRRIAKKWDAAGINGTGASGEPIGILQTPGIGTYDWGGRTAAAYTSYDDLVKMIGKLITANALFGNLKWLLSPDMLEALKTRVDRGTNTNDNQPTERRVLSAAFPDTLLGYPYVCSTQAPAKTIVFGNWEEMYRIGWGTMFLTTDSLTAQKLLKIQILSAMEVDFQVAHVESFAVATTIG